VGEASPVEGPERVGKYILFEALGSGSMGEVHRARTFGPGGVVKDLCIKRIHADRLSRPGVLDRFVSEARLSMRLAHANIVPVFDFGRAGDQYFLAMEWVDGTDLGRIVEEAEESGVPIPPVLAAHVVAEVARALDYAHHHEGQPIVHRDVKPGNVLISRAGDVRLTDFGVAIAADEVRAPVGGTPGYMAPEQWRRGPIDARVDLYALGRILVRVLTGDLPEEDGPDGVAWAAVPADITPVLRSMLARDPAERPARGRDVADVLEGFVAHARVAGSGSPRDRLAQLASDAATTRQHARPGVDPASFVAEATGQFTPDLSLKQIGDPNSFVTAVTRDVIGEPVTPIEPPGPPPPGASPGQRFGRYTLSAELASGGMATVYLAKAEGPGGFEKLIALKRIHPHLAKETSFVEMFLDEARIASRIDHPNVCSVFDFGKVDGGYYIAMEFIQGETLGAVYKKIAASREEREAPTWPALAAHVVADACEGLHAAHETKDDHGKSLDVIHRDISPQNLFLAFDGHVSIVDFGIARAEGRLHKTKTGAMKGKLGYVSPEQCTRQELDRRVDIWAMGIVLWELLTGEKLFRRNNDPDTLMAVLDATIAPPSKLNPKVPPALDRVVLKALSRDRDERYATARELGRDLARVIASSPEPVSRADLAEWMERVFGQEQKHLEDIIAHVRVPPVIDDRTQEVDEGELIEVRPPAERISHAPQTEEDSPWRALLWVAAVILVAVVGVWVGSEWLATEGVRDGSGDEVPSPEPNPEPVAAEGEGAETIGEADDAPEPHDDQMMEFTLGGELLGPDDPEPVPEAALPEEEEEQETEEQHEVEETSHTTTHSRRHRRGRVNIATPGGWADVFIGEQRIGRSPGTIRLRPGSYRLRLLPFGRGPEKAATIQVRAGQRTRVIVPLNR
jgi:serine/threonine-protein kinase